MPDIMPGQTEMEEQEPDRREEEHGGIRFFYFARWTDRYKEAREYLYGTMGEEPDEEAAHEIMLEEAEQEMRMPCTTWERFMHRHWM